MHPILLVPAGPRRVETSTHVALALLCALAAAVALAALAPARAASLASRSTATQPPDPFDNAVWRPLAGAGARAGHDAVVDVAGGRMIVHGGESALFMPAGPTAAYDLVRGTWSVLAAAGSAPEARLAGRGIMGGSLVLDTAERVLLAQCDCQDGNAFLLDLAADRWLPAPNDSDVPYVDVLAGFDAQMDRAVFYGGAFRGLDEPSMASFAYDLSPGRSGWTALPDVPFLLQYQAFDRDDLVGHLLAFGGQDAGGEATAELWRLDLALADQEGAWVELTPGAEDAWPLPRIGATLTFLAGTGRALLFGGYDPVAGVSFGDLWLLDATDPDRPRWTAIDVPGGPSARSGHSAVWDPEGRDLIVHGGVSVAGTRPTYYGDAWALDIDPETDPPTATATATSTPSPTVTGEPSATATATEPAEPTIYLPMTTHKFDAAAP